MKREFWENYSFVIRGKLRREVIKHIDNPTTPRELSKEINIHLSEASRVLIELSKKGLFQCLTPKLRSGRVYEITKKGKEIKYKLK